MQSAFFKSHYFWSLLIPILMTASGKVAWQQLDEGIDFVKGSLNINIMSISHQKQIKPSSLLVYVARVQGPNPSFTLASPAIQHGFCLLMGISRQNYFPRSYFIYN
jgi:hypothetical protein